MNAIDLLKHDHKSVHKLFLDYMSTHEDDVDRREELFQGIEKQLLAHSDAEEQIFYPAVKNHAPEMIEEALSDHQEVKQLLSEMLEFEVDDEEFDKRINTLMEKVEAHVDQEEGPGGVFEIARERIGDQELEDMGWRIEQRKQSTHDELAA